MSVRKKYLLVVPVFQAVYPAPFANFVAMALVAGQRAGVDVEYVPHVPGRTILHQAMNQAASVVLAEGFDGLIVCDDDCTPPFDAIPRLVAHHAAGHPIVAGMGFMRRFPFTTTIGRYFPEGISIAANPINGQIELAGFEWIDDVATEPHDLIPCDFCGFPIALIGATALAAMERPWFGTHINGGDCTHDVYFGWRAKAAKQPIVVDRSIACGHLMDAETVTEHNRAFAREIRRATEAALAEVVRASAATASSEVPA